MKFIKKFWRKYFDITNGVYNQIVPLEDIDNGNISNEVINFLDENYSNRFKIELLMFPNWAIENKSYKIGNDYFTHIRIKEKCN